MDKKLHIVFRKECIDCDGTGHIYADAYGELPAELASVKTQHVCSCCGGKGYVELLQKIETFLDYLREELQKQEVLK